MPSNVDAALWYAEKLGWAVLPIHTPDPLGGCSCGADSCKSVGKHPRTAHGAHDATSDRAQIIDWWRAWPDANVGIATGKISGIIVIDVDPRNGGDETLAKLARRKRIPRNVIARTGGQGKHYFYAYTDSDLIHKPGPGIDLKSDGGFVVAAPSVHVSGAKYYWIRRPRKDTHFKPLPSWAIAKNGNNARQNSAQGRPRRLLRNGERNDGLASHAGRLRRLGIDEQELYAALWSHNQQYCDPALDEREVRTIARSVARYDAPSDALARRAAQQEVGARGSDLGNALRLVEIAGDVLRWTPGLGWLVWDGRRWAVDHLNTVRLKAHEVGQAIRDEALEAGLDEKELARALHKADAAESNRAITDMVKIASTLPEMAAHDSEFDRDPWLLNVENGTVDLRTGRLRDHSPDDYITKLAPVTYDSRAKAPRFEQFLSETFGGDEALIAYLQRLIGYSLTSIVDEQVFSVFWGKGGNGKTRLIEDAIGATLGRDYVAHLPASTLLAKRTDRPNSELMSLRGARLAVASESGASRRLDEELIKSLTGGDTIKARALYRDWIDFAPTHHLILVTNNKPRANSEDAIWRRVQMLPFKYKPKEIDVTLGDKLRSEASGILRWAVEGCLIWQREGLNPPREVVSITMAQRKSEDYLGMFIEECTYRSRKVRCLVGALHEAYIAWSLANGLKWMGKIRFNRELEERDLGLRKYKSEGKWLWKGIKIMKNSDK